MGKEDDKDDKGKGGKKNKKDQSAADNAHKKKATEKAAKAGTHYVAAGESITSSRGRVVTEFEPMTEMDFRREYQSKEEGEANMKKHVDKRRLLKGKPPAKK